MINDAVAGQARRFVWGVDDRQLRFVERRLGEMRAMHAAEVTEYFRWAVSGFAARPKGR